MQPPHFVHIHVAKEIPYGLTAERNDDFRLNTFKLQLQMMAGFLVVFLRVRHTLVGRRPAEIVREIPTLAGPADAPKQTVYFGADWPLERFAPNHIFPAGLVAHKHELAGRWARAVNGANALVHLVVGALRCGLQLAKELRRPWVVLALLGLLLRGLLRKDGVDERDVLQGRDVQLHG